MSGLLDLAARLDARTVRTLPSNGAMRPRNYSPDEIERLRDEKRQMIEAAMAALASRKARTEEAE